MGGACEEASCCFRSVRAPVFSQAAERGPTCCVGFQGRKGRASDAVREFSPARGDSGGALVRRTRAPPPVLDPSWGILLFQGEVWMGLVCRMSDAVPTPCEYFPYGGEPSTQVGGPACLWRCCPPPPLGGVCLISHPHPHPFPSPSPCSHPQGTEGAGGPGAEVRSGTAPVGHRDFLLAETQPDSVPWAAAVGLQASSILWRLVAFSVGLTGASAT